MKRRKFLELSLGSGLAMAGTSSLPIASEPVGLDQSTSRSDRLADGVSPVWEIGADSEIFLDDFLIQRSEGVWRSVNHPKKFAGNPVIKPDRPWEGYLILQPGTVLFDKAEGKFKMWYLAAPSKWRPPSKGGSWDDCFLCYATSEDGLAWEKPDLGLTEFRGSRANNIILTKVNWDHCLVEDKNDPDSSKRYKLLYWQSWDKEHCGIWTAFSSDGIHWQNPLTYPSVPCSATSDTFSVMRDPVSKQYFLFHKTVLGRIRKVSRLVSDDLINWRDDRLILEPDAHDQPDTQLYGLSGFRYGNQYVGMLWVFHTYLQSVDTQLVSSRDGLHWGRALNRMIFLPLGYMVVGYKGYSFDSKMIWPTSAPIQKDDELWIYYSGFSNPHNALSSEYTGQIGVARLRLDGFCSLDATSEGFIVTRPIKLEGSTLFVNAQVNSNEAQPLGSHPTWRGLFAGTTGEGYVRVEVQDEVERPIEGYSAAESLPLRGDGVHQKVSWGRGKGLSALRGRAVRFKFIIANTKLYSFEVRQA